MTNDRSVARENGLEPKAFRPDPTVQATMTLTSWVLARAHVADIAYSTVCDALGLDVSGMQGLQDGTSEWTLEQLATAARLLGVSNAELAEVWQTARELEA